MEDSARSLGRRRRRSPSLRSKPPNANPSGECGVGQSPAVPRWLHPAGPRRTLQHRQHDWRFTMPSASTTRRWTMLACLAIAAPMVTQCKAQPPETGPAQRSPTPSSIDGNITAETVVRGLVHPWALAFLPDGRILVTERPGRVRIVDRNGRLSEPLAGVPDVVARGQGGLLDVAIDPNFNENRLVY